MNCNGKFSLSTRSSQDPYNFLCEAGGLELLFSRSKEQNQQFWFHVVLIIMVTIEL